MKTRIINLVALCIIVSVPFLFIPVQRENNSRQVINEAEKVTDERARFHEERLRYDFELLKDPATNKIPLNILEEEKAFARTLPVKVKGFGNNSSRTTVLNTYIPAGPNNVGARTRALAYDQRYNGTTNRVIIAGSVSGGIMRTADGGSTWTRVSPPNDIHNVSTVVQDPRPAFQNTWYVGSGEHLGISASEVGATYFGQYIWKSVDNGINWVRLPLNTIADIPGNAPIGVALEAFDHPFDFVHKLAINPVNGDLYIACHRRLIRSLDGGNTFQTVFGSTVGANSSNGQSDIVISNTGKLLLVVNGGNPDVNLRGVWTSTLGGLGTWTRIAGGPTLGVDSVDGWRANSPSNISKRILVTLVPQIQNIAYVFYENGLSNESPDFKPEADLYKLDMTTGSNIWTNLSANMPDMASGNLNGSDPLTVQGGYDMLVKVKPDDPNVIFIGGSNLYRSNDGFTTPVNTIAGWINGYQTNFTFAYYPGGHPDMHNLDFNPVNPSEAISADDGGVRVTSNIMTSPVSWSPLPNYQTLQYYYVAIDPGEGRNNFTGGAQDNGTYFRDKLGILAAASDSNNHLQINGGDGCGQGFSKLNIADQNQYIYGSSQYGNIRRIRLTNGFQNTAIRPNGLTPAFAGSTSEFGEFVTNFRLDPDNTEDLYYVNFNRLFRTTSAATVTAGGWLELTGVSQAVNPGNPTAGRDVGIRALAFSRGPYATSHALYIGTTNGRIFRLDDPRNTLVTTVPINITPPGLTGNVQDIATNPNNDDEVIAVVTNYNVVSIWWTNNAKDAAPNWRNGEGNLTLPSARSCMIVVKKDASNNPVTEYYVGTSVGLYSVQNLGTTLIGGAAPVWQREGDNILNLAVIQSLSYRPGDNVLLVGTHGNGMYYTFLGPANFNANQNTGIDPVLNDKSFITKVFPTSTKNRIDYQTGTIFSIKKISVQLFNLAGQQVFSKEDLYQGGSINLANYARGIYILAITSDNKKFRHIQKVLRE